MKQLLAITLAFSLLFVAKAATSNDDEGETKTTTVLKKISRSDLINIKAKYTDLIIEAWDKNEVEITATIRFDGKMNDEMSEFLENFAQNVEENIEYSGGELTIDTDLDEPNKFQIGSKNVGIVIGFSDDELKLEYAIKAPASNKYKIKNAYKDLRMIGDFETVSIDQYSGDLRAESFKEANLTLKYGSAEVGNIQKASMDIYEQKINLKTVGELDITAKYSDLKIGNIGEMKGNAYESDFIINTATSISGEHKYGEIVVTDTLLAASLEFYEMDLDIDYAERIKLAVSKYSEIKINDVKSLTFGESYEDETNIGVIHEFVSKDSKYGDHTIATLTGILELSAYEDNVKIRAVAPTAEKISIKGKYIDALIGIEGIGFSLNANTKYGGITYDESKVDVRKYIKENDELKIEASAKNNDSKPVEITVSGYEIDLELD